MSALDEFKNHISAMVAGNKSPATLYTNDDIIERATGVRRGKGSISIFSAETYTTPGVNDDLPFTMIEVNSELDGYRGTQRLPEFMEWLDVIAAEGVEFTRCEIGVGRDRRATWQLINDDSANGNRKPY